MIVFEGGPADSQSLNLRSAPFLVRAVVNHRGLWDALNEPDDEPKPHEQIFVYMLKEPATRYHIRCSPRSRSGYYAMGTYMLFPEQPLDATMRERAQWEAWLTDQQEWATKAADRGAEETPSNYIRRMVKLWTCDNAEPA